jgi:hypothetical protein
MPIYLRISGKKQAKLLNIEEKHEKSLENHQI